jgi:hypothetical protein
VQVAADRLALVRVITGQSRCAWRPAASGLHAGDASPRHGTIHRPLRPCRQPTQCFAGAAAETPAVASSSARRPKPIGFRGAWASQKTLRGAAAPQAGSGRRPDAECSVLAGDRARKAASRKSGSREFHESLPELAAPRRGRSRAHPATGRAGRSLTDVAIEPVGRWCHWRRVGGATGRRGS